QRGRRATALRALARRPQHLAAARGGGTARARRRRHSRASGVVPPARGPGGATAGARLLVKDERRQGLIGTFLKTAAWHGGKDLRTLQRAGKRKLSSQGAVTVAVICWRSDGVTNPLGLPVIRRMVVPTRSGWNAAVDWQVSPAVKGTFGATIVPTAGVVLASDTVVPRKPARSVPTPA